MKMLTFYDTCVIFPRLRLPFCLAENWTGTVLDILDGLAAEEYPAEDQLEIVLREDFIDARTLRLFAVWCSRRAFELVHDPNPLIVTAVDVAERYANGDATDDELAAARGAAWNVIDNGDKKQAKITVWGAALSDAGDAAQFAAKNAAWIFACSEHCYIGWDAAIQQAWEALASHLRKMLKADATLVSA